MYGTEGQKWPDVMGALKRNKRSDGKVTLLLERLVWADDEDRAVVNAAVEEVEAGKGAVGDSS